MKLVNTSNNTIYVQDIDKHIYFNNQVYDISSDELLKSNGLQQLILMGQLEVKEFGDSRIERNLERLVSKMTKLRSVVKSENQFADTAPPSIESKKQVVIKGHFLEGGGYAKCNRNLAIGLKACGIDVNIDVVGGAKNELTPNEARMLASLRGSCGKNAIRIDSVVPTFSNISSGRRSILFTTIEAGSVPQQFVDVANSYHEVWVTSDFCKEVLQKYSVKRPIVVVPNSINTGIYKPDGDEYAFRPALKDFVFVSVFGWSYRKGWDALLKAYLKAFSGKDDVSLLLVSKAQGGSKVIKDDVSKYIKEYGTSNPPHIVRCSKSIPENQMPSLYRACDAFVLFSRGEGFGLPYCESSLCGLPVIATKCSGHTMFLNNDNSTLVDVDRYEKVREGTMHVHYWDNQIFPSLKSDKFIDEAADAMRTAYKNYGSAVNKNEKLREYIMSNYSIGSVVKRVIDRLDTVWSD